MGAAERYVLRWHYHEATLCKNLPFLLESDVLTDCTISAGERNFKAHRVILATCSPYFLQIFQNSGPLEFPILILPDCKAEDMEAILSYIYRGQCLVTNEQLPSFILLAKSLKIQGLCTMKIGDGFVKGPPIDREETTKPQGCENFDYSDPGRNQIEQNSANVTTNPCEVVSDESNKETFHITDLHCKKSIKDVPEICKCFVCGKYLSNQYNLRVHMETHKHNYYSCLSCPHISKSRDALRKHVSYRHPEEYTSRKRRKHDLI